MTPTAGGGGAPSGRRRTVPVPAAEATPRPLVRRLARAALVRLFGRQINCSECGRPLFVAVPLVWRGELRLIGTADERVVEVSFSWTDRLEFRHVELDKCPSPQRPWVT